MKFNLYEKFGIAATIGVFLFVISAFAAWGTHVVTCLQNSEWLFLVAGAIMVPIAIVHGYGIWFGIW